VVLATVFAKSALRRLQLPVVELVTQLTAPPGTKVALKVTPRHGMLIAVVGTLPVGYRPVPGQHAPGEFDMVKPQAGVDNESIHIAAGWAIVILDV